jgi:general secretion pathway protein M
MAEQRVALEQRLATLRLARAQNRNFLAGDSPALAAATLQQVIKDAITDAGGSVVSAQVLAPAAEKHLQRIALKLRMTGDIGAMQRSLYAIESVRPLMFVDSLDITSSRKRARRGKTVDGSVPLRATLEISGYRRIGGS